MKPKFLNFVGIAVLAAGAALAQPVQAGVQRHVVQELNLSQAQKDQTRAIAKDARQSAKPLMDQLEANRQVLTAAVKANDTAQIEQLAFMQGELRGQLLKIRSQAMAKFYALLTPDQRAKADQMQLKTQKLFGQRRKAG